MIGCCGIDCSSCGAMLAERNDDQALREKTAREWTAAYSHPFKPEDIACDGCTGGGKLIGHAAHECQIRACCVGKELTTCAECDEFPCEVVAAFHENVPDAKANIGKLRES